MVVDRLSSIVMSVSHAVNQKVSEDLNVANEKAAKKET